MSLSIVTATQSQKTVLITGAAQGLGREICRQMAAKGWCTVVADLDRVQGELCAAECRELRPDADSLFVWVDLGTAEGPSQMVDAAVRHFGRLDVLINCAAYATAEAFTEMSAGAWETTLLVNVRGLALATAAAAAPMARQGGGRIINITSPASRMALPNYVAYAASKAAVDSLTRSSAVALAPKNIQVNSVAPGMMDTPLQIKTEAIFAALEGQSDFKSFQAARTARIPAGRRVSCQEVAQTVVWLAADAPDYVTAERLNISGGLDKD
ncbi:MAG: SDR family oxidoreductase [Pedosphaera sp.]|nr:SDR family oxidoreductase [Pedosphaera sp.]